MIGAATAFALALIAAPQPHAVQLVRLPATSIAAPSPLASSTPEAADRAATSSAATSSNGWAVRLYTPEGHDRAATALLPSDGLAPATHATQAALLARQFPPSCAAASFLVSRGYCGNGIGAMIHITSTHLGMAYAANRTLVMAPEVCPAWSDNVTCPAGGAGRGFFECFLAPISSCTAADAAAAGAPEVAGTDETFMHSLPTGAMLPHRVPAALADGVRSMGWTEHELKYWWRGQSAAYLLRFNARTVAALRAMRLQPGTLVVHSAPTDGPASAPTAALLASAFPLPPGVVSAHVRSGKDKAGEMSLKPAMVFLQAAEKLVTAAPQSAMRALFISTEGPEIIDTARRIVQLRRTAAPWALAYTDTPRGVGGDTGETGTTREAAVHLPSASVQPLGVSTRQHLLNLLIALECDAWIGTRGSNWNRLIDELRCVWVPKCHAPFIEVGDNAAEYNW